MRIPKNVDKKKTRINAIKVLEQAHFARIMGTHDKEQSLTMSYTPRYHKGPVGAVTKETEDIAIRNIELKEICRKVDRALMILEGDERDIIERYYLDSVRVPDLVLFQELNMSRRTYYRKKKKALLKVAQATGRIVFKNQEEQEGEEKHA